MIHWYPGHMHKALQDLKKVCHYIDLSIELIDARLPETCRNEALTVIFSKKPHIILLTKTDLSDTRVTQFWLKHYKKTAAHVMAVDLRQATYLKRKMLCLVSRCVSARGTILKPIRAVVFGLPNVGKSTFVNLMHGKRSEKTGNEPAVTRMLKRIEINKSFYLYDTPGIMFAKPKNEASGQKLALIGSIRDTAVDYVQAADFLLSWLKTNHVEALQKRYLTIDTNQENDDLLMAIGQVIGQKEYLSICKRLVQDFRKLKFGRLSLDNIV